LTGAIRRKKEAATKKATSSAKEREKKAAFEAHDHWCRAVIPCNSFLFCDAFFHASNRK